MTALFEVKRLLDEMNTLGDRYVGVVKLSEAAADVLNIHPDAPVVEVARNYMIYEMKCFAISQKPMPLGEWYYASQKARKRIGA